MTRPEIVLWTYLRNHGVAGAHFRRQHAMGPYILDFYCSAHRICIEIDGITHSTPEAARHDEARTQWLDGQGVRVVRFAAADIFTADGLAGVLTAIESLVARPEPEQPLRRLRRHLPRCAGEGDDCASGALRLVNALFTLVGESEGRGGGKRGRGSGGLFHLRVS